MSDYLMLYREDDQEKLREWWKSLDDNRGNRGSRAQLRRAGSPGDVLLTSAFAHFLKVMPRYWSGPPPIRLYNSAMVAGLMAQVKTDDPTKSFAQALAVSKGTGAKAAMSELRFQQLLKSRDPDEFFRRMSRAVALLDGKVNLLSLADGALLWLKERREAVHKNPVKRLAVHWALNYYTALAD